MICRFPIVQILVDLRIYVHSGNGSEQQKEPPHAASFDTMCKSRNALTDRFKLRRGYRIVLLPRLFTLQM